MDLKDPKILGLGVVGLVVLFLLMRNKGGGSTVAPQTDATTTTTPIGQSYSYLDGSGYEHLTATDPYGNLVNYSSIPPSVGQPQTGQMPTYVGGMSGVSTVSPYGGTTPPYS